MSGFDRLTNALQYQIVNTLGFTGLRPVQEQSIDAVLDGKNCVVLAPTAGGKTEAAFFPILSLMDAGDWRPVSVIYLSPIRALLNNQEDRVSRYAGTIGRRVFKWHGDVTDSVRKRFIREPADILLTTPESLEAMMMSTRVPARALFAGLQTVVVDEIHAFAADDRGAHLSAVLERLSRFCGRDVQRIGLSATVGNPEEILRWVQGSSRREGIVVDPGGAKKVPELAIDYVASIENAATVVQQLHPGRKRLVFVDSRRKAEQLGKLLLQQGVQAFVSHGSLALTERRDAEKAFHEGSDCVIVATSALELGIDVGDLDHVLQIDSPPSVASFLQRMGRTGRRGDTPPNCTFLCMKDSTVLQAAAVVRLFREKWVESVSPSRRAHHILAHQIMAIAVERDGVVRGDIAAWIDGAAAFADITRAELAELIDTMLERNVLADHDGKLWLGPEGEKKYGRANFRELYAVFSVPHMFTVTCDAREVGTVDAKFLRTLSTDDTDKSFTLAGQPWEIVHIEWERGKCIVRPSADGRAPRWSGGPRFLSYELCQSMKRILLSDSMDPAWKQRAQRVIETQRAEHGFLREGRDLLDVKQGIEWWTFAGGAANTLLARMLERDLGARVIARNTSLTLSEKAGDSVAAIRELIAKWRIEGRPSESDAEALAAPLAKGELSKFEPCLPASQAATLQIARTFDLPGSRVAVLHGDRAD